MTRARSAAVRETKPSVDLEAGPLGLGVVLWMHDAESATRHDAMAAAGATILQATFDGRFGATLVFQDLDGYAITLHDRTTPARAAELEGARMRIVRAISIRGKVPSEAMGQHET